MPCLLFRSIWQAATVRGTSSPSNYGILQHHSRIILSSFLSPMTLLCFQLDLLYLSSPCILLNSSLFPISVCFPFSVWSPFYSAAWLMLSSCSLSTLVCQVIAITVQSRPLLSLNLRRRGSRKILLSNFKPILHSQWPPTLCELWWILILKLGVMRGEKSARFVHTWRTGFENSDRLQCRFWLHSEEFSLWMC